MSVKGDQYQATQTPNTVCKTYASNITILIYRSWNDSIWNSKALMLPRMHVQTVGYATHMYEEGGRHRAMAGTLT